MGCVAKAVPAVAVDNGSWVITNWLAAAGLTVNEPLFPVVKLVAVALRVKLPAWLISRPLPVIVPSPPLVPML